MANGKRGRKGVLSVVIDPLLFEGGRTVREIALLLEGQLGGTYKLPVIINNVRSRLVVFQQHGYTLEKTDDKKVRLVAPTATPAATETATA